MAYYTAIHGGVDSEAVARALVERLVEDARIQGKVVVPLCPFVRSEAQRNPHWSDIIRSGPNNLSGSDCDPDAGIFLSKDRSAPLKQQGQKRPEVGQDLGVAPFQEPSQ